MRIAIISSFPPMPCGIGIYAKDLSEALAERGHEVHVIATKWKDAPEEEEVRGVKVHRVWERGHERFHVQILEAVEEFGPFDVIEVQYEYGLWPVIPLDGRGMWLMRRLRLHSRSLFATLHTVRLSQDEEWVSYHRELADVVDGIIVHHFHMENALYRMLGELHNTYIVPHGSRALPGKRTVLKYERPTVLLFGLLREDKGLDVAVNAMEMLGKGTLIVAGAGLEGRKLTLNEVAHVVTINKFLSDEELGSLMRSVDYVVFPYLDLPNDFGISGALHSALLTAEKVLCSRVQRLAECWERAPEATFRPGDAEELATLLSEGVPSDAFARLKRYGELTSWSNVAKLRERLYQRFM